MRPTHRRLCLTIALLAAAPLPSAWAATTPVQATAETGNYRLELDIGDPEQMFSKADVARLKPTSGEIMVSGQMAGGAGGMQDALRRKVIGIGIAGALTGNNPNATAAGNSLGSGLHQRFIDH